MTPDPGEPCEIPGRSGALLARRWRGAGPAVVVAIHGVESHALWFGSLGAALAERGASLLAVDRAGSGRDGRPRGDSPGAAAWLDEVAGACAAAAQAGAAVHLLGHSWGAKNAALALFERDVAARSAVFVTPGLFPAQDPARPDPEALAGDGVDLDALLPDDRFTDDPAVLAFLQRDPLRLRRVTRRFALEDRRLSRALAARGGPLPVPALLVLAERDRIVDPRATQRWFGAAAARGASEVVAGAGHLVILERAGELAARLARWIAEVP